MGEGFNALIGALQRRQIVEAEQFAHQQAQNHQIFSEVMAKAQETAKKKMEQNQYQYAATKTGVAEPVEKPTPHEIEINNAIAKTQAEYDKTQQELASIQIPQQQSGYSNAVKKQQDAINTRRKLADVIQQNKKLLEAYKQTPQYIDTVKQQAIRQWMNDNPVGSPKYYETQDKYATGEYAQQQAIKQSPQRQRMSVAEEGKLQSRQQQGLGYIDKTLTSKTASLFKPEEKKQYEDIAQTYRDAISKASSENEVIQLEAQYAKQLGITPEAPEVTLPKPGFLASKATKEAYTKQQQQMLQKIADKMGQKYSK